MPTTTAALSLTLLVTVLAVVVPASAPRLADINLYADGIAVSDDGTLVSIPAGTAAEYPPGTRVVDPAATDRAAADRAWLASARLPGADGPYADLVAGALLDLRALAGPDGALIAGNSPRWRYVWPRDASFAAAALDGM